MMSAVTRGLLARAVRRSLPYIANPTLFAATSSLRVSPGWTRALSTQDDSLTVAIVPADALIPKVVAAIVPEVEATLTPEMAAQWHPTKNGDLTLANIKDRKLSCKKFWWQCDVSSDHEWKASKHRRVTKGADCPFCSGKQLSVTNSLAKLKPKVAAAWDYSGLNDCGPEDVLAESNKKYWFNFSGGDDTFHSEQRKPRSFKHVEAVVLEVGMFVSVNAGQHAGRIGTVKQVKKTQVVLTSEGMADIVVYSSSVEPADAKLTKRLMAELEREEKVDEGVKSKPGARSKDIKGYMRAYYVKHLPLLLRRAHERHCLVYFRRCVQARIAREGAGLYFQDVIKLFTDRFFLLLCPVLSLFPLFIVFLCIAHHVNDSTVIAVA
jgi:hypothetical protein